MFKSKTERPEIIFDNMSRDEIKEFCYASSEYLVFENQEKELLVVITDPYTKTVYEIYSQMNQIPQSVLDSLSGFGYKIFFTEYNLHHTCTPASSSFIGDMLTLYFDKEFNFYVYL